jgi:hypothetical protein
MNEQRKTIYNIKEKSENPRFYGQMKLFSYDLAVQSLGDSSHMATRSSSENIGKNECNAHLKQNFFFFSFFFSFISRNEVTFHCKTNQYNQTPK